MDGDIDAAVAILRAALAQPEQLRAMGARARECSLAWNQRAFSVKMDDAVFAGGGGDANNGAEGTQ